MVIHGDDHSVFLCIQGQIRNNSQSLVALSTCDGIRGFISDGVETFYIENNRNNQNRKHYLIR